MITDGQMGILVVSVVLIIFVVCQTGQNIITRVDELEIELKRIMGMFYDRMGQLEKKGGHTTVEIHSNRGRRV